MEILRCENVRKVYGSGNNQVVALDHIDLSIQKGEFAAITGASGSGKSTLLHILGSVDKPTEGKVLIEGTDISTMNRTQAAIFRRRKVGLVYQFFNLIPTLTIRKKYSHAASVGQAKTHAALDCSENPIRSILSKSYIHWELKINWKHCQASYPADSSSVLPSPVL